MSTIEPLYDKNCICLLCETPFITKKIRSRFVKVVSYDSDFAPNYAEWNPLLYYIKVCPGCGFSFSDDTSAQLSQEIKLKLIEKVCNHWVPRSYSMERSVEQAIVTYKLAAYCATLKEEKQIQLASLYIRIAWLYRSSQNMTQENRFMDLALESYRNSFETGDFKTSKVSELRLLFIMGELSRRLGLLEPAKQYFSKVIEMQRQTTEKNIVNMAKEGWQQIKESS